MSAQTILPTPELVYIGTPPIPLNLPSPLPHRVRGWVAEVADLTAPDGIQWCDGSAAELELLADLEMFSRATATTPDEPPPWGATHQDLSVGGAGSGSPGAMATASGLVDGSGGRGIVPVVKS